MRLANHCSLRPIGINDLYKRIPQLHVKIVFHMWFMTLRQKKNTNIREGSTLPCETSRKAYRRFSYDPKTALTIFIMVFLFDRLR